MVGGERKERGVEIPKSMIVERIRSRDGAEAANNADRELPEKLDLDGDAELLSRYNLDADEIREEFGGQPPVAG
jgi:hypothetical protein